MLCFPAFNPLGISIKFFLKMPDKSKSGGSGLDSIQFGYVCVHVLMCGMEMGVSVCVPEKQVTARTRDTSSQDRLYLL